MTRNQEQRWLEYIDNNQSTIIERIIATRECYGLEQEWVAEKAGYSISQYLKFEAGERQLDYEDILRISMVMLDYRDSKLPPLTRLSVKIDQHVDHYLFRLQDFLQSLSPEIENVFERITINKLLRRVVIWSSVIFLIYHFQITAYGVGLFLGNVYRGLDTFINDLNLSF